MMSVLLLSTIPNFGTAAVVGDITGTVHDIGGNPVAGAYVALVDINGDPLALGETETDANGNFVFTSPTLTGTTHIRAHKDTAEGYAFNVASGGQYQITLSPIAAEDTMPPSVNNTTAVAEPPTIGADFPLPVPPLPAGLGEAGNLTNATVGEIQTSYVPATFSMLSNWSGQDNATDGNTSEDPADPLPTLPEGMAEPGDQSVDHEMNESQASSGPIVWIFTPTQAFPWVPLVPVTVDMTGNNVLDTVITIQSVNGGEICLLVQVALENSGPRYVGLRHDTPMIQFTWNRLPSQVKICGSQLSDGGKVWYEASAAVHNYAWRVDVTGSGVAASMVFSTFPKQMSATGSKYNDGFDLAYSADRSSRFYMEIWQPISAKAWIDRLPSSFSGTFYKSDYNSWRNHYFNYDASASIANLDFWVRPAYGTEVTVNIDYVPASYSGTFSVLEHGSLTFSRAEYGHSASSTTTLLKISGTVNYKAFFFQMRDIPAEVYELSYELTDSGSVRDHILYYYSPSGESIKDVIFQLSTQGDYNWFYLSTPSIPYYVYATLRTREDNDRINEVFYSHDASAGVPSIAFRGTFAGSLEVAVDLVDIPSKASASFVMNPYQEAKITPRLTYSASTAGFDITAYVYGAAINSGYVWIDVDNLPTKFVTTLTEGEWDDIMTFDMSTQGTGTLDQLYIEARFPDIDFNAVYVYFTGLRHVQLEVEWYCALRACIHFDYKDVSYFDIKHPSIVVGDSVSWGINIPWQVQQYHVSCLCWISEYYAYNRLVYYTPYLDTSLPTRGVIW